jgi:hypothetical protein
MPLVPITAIGFLVAFLRADMPTHWVFLVLASHGHPTDAVRRGGRRLPDIS